MKGIVYQIANISTEELYVGSSKQFRRRLQMHQRNLKAGKHHSWKLQADYDFVGWDGFEVTVLEECQVEDMLIKEQHYIDTLKPFYNISTTAHTPTSTPEGRRRQAQKLKDHALHIFGFPVSHWAERLGISEAVISYRLRKGWDLHRVFNDPIQTAKATGRMLTFQGDTLLLGDMARKYGWASATLSRRLKEGLSLEEALLKPAVIGGYRARWSDRAITFQGETMSRAKLAKKYNVSENMLRLRLKKGFSIEAAMAEAREVRPRA